MLESGRYFYLSEMMNFPGVVEGDLNIKAKIDAALRCGVKVDVCFLYDKGTIIDGVVIRDDKEYPFVTIIRLSDGRVILATECQFSPIQDVDKSVIEQFTFKNNGKT